MIRALYSSATGMKAQETLIDVTANNLANVNTNGFKRSQVDFADLLYSTIRQAGTSVADGLPSPTGLQIGSGVRTVGTTKLFTPGSFEQTGNPFDVAIEGEGFFKILLPDGSERYTRDGAFRLNAQGEIVTGDGYALADTIQIPQGADNVTIGVDGTVTYLLNGQGSPQTTGPIQLARFQTPAGLSREGCNLYAATDASGTEVVGIAGEQGAGLLRGQFLERSNVDLETERRHLEETATKLFMFEKLLRLR